MVADDESGTDAPSLAPPSVGFGLRRRAKAGRTPEPAPARDEPAPAASAPVGPGTIFDVVPSRAPLSPTPPSESAASPVAEFTAEPAPQPVAAPQPAASIPAAVEQPEVVPGLVPDPVVWTQPTTPDPTTRDLAGPASADQASEDEPRRRLADRVRDRLAAAPRPGSTTATRAPRTPQAPAWLHGRAAAVVVGAAVGLMLVVTTGLVLRGCELARGTATCGGGPGFFLLVAVLILAALLGSALLRATRSPAPGSTSVLAVGLTAVVALVFLSDQLFEWWMLIAMPLVSAGTFALSHWVTTVSSEEPHDGHQAAAPGTGHDDHDDRVTGAGSRPR